MHKCSSALKLLSKLTFFVVAAIPILSLLSLESAHCIEPPKTRFNPDDLLIHGQNQNRENLTQDLQLLKYALDEGYVGFEFMGQNIKKNVFKEIDSALRNPDKLSPEDLCDQLGKAFEMVPDGHFQIQLNNRSCPLVHSDLRRTSVGSNFGFDSRTKDTPSWSIATVSAEDRKIPVISLFKFPTPKHLDWNGFDSEF